MSAQDNPGSYRLYMYFYHTYNQNQWRELKKIKSTTFMQIFAMLSTVRYLLFERLSLAMLSFCCWNKHRKHHLLCSCLYYCTYMSMTPRSVRIGYNEARALPYSAQETEQAFRKTKGRMKR